MADRGVSLKSNQWSCSELSRGAEVCADMAGLTLTLDPQKLSKEQLLQAIQDLAAKILHSIAMAFAVPVKILSAKSLSHQEAKNVLQAPGTES